MYAYVHIKVNLQVAKWTNSRRFDCFDMEFRRLAGNRWWLLRVLEYRYTTHVCRMPDLFFDRESGNSIDWLCKWTAESVGNFLQKNVVCSTRSKLKRKKCNSCSTTMLYSNCESQWEYEMVWVQRGPAKFGGGKVWAGTWQLGLGKIGTHIGIVRASPGVFGEHSMKLLSAFEFSFVRPICPLET